MRVFIIAIFTFWFLNASANDSIQVWYEHFINSIKAQEYNEAEKNIDKLINQWKTDNNEVDSTYTYFLYYKLLAQCGNNKFIEANVLLHEIEKIWDLTGLSKESELYSQLLNFKSIILENIGAELDSVLYVRLESLELDYRLHGKIQIHNIPTLINVASLYSDKGDYMSAIKYCESGIKLSREYLSPDDINLSVYLSTLSENYTAVGDYQNALKIALEATSIVKIHKKEYNDLYASSLLKLALCYSDLSDFNHALKIAKDAIILCGDDRVSTVIRSAYDGIARIYFAMGDYSNALQYSQKALEVSESLGEYGTESYITILNELGIFYNHLADYDKAISLQKEAISLAQERYGTSHPIYASLISNLATTYSRIGEKKIALELEEQAMNICKESKDFIGSISTINGISILYDEMGLHPQALRYSKEAKELCEKVIGTDHPQYARCLSGLADIYASCGNFDRAIDYQKRALNIIRKLLGDKHPQYASSLNNLANYFYELNQYDKAIEYQEQALKISEMIYGTNHPDYAISLGNLAQGVACVGQIERAISIREKAMSINRLVYGEQSIYYAIDLENMAIYFALLGNYEQAINYNFSALKILNSIVGNHHPHYIQVLDILSTTLELQNKYQEALKYRDEAVLKKQMEISRLFTDMNSEGRERYWNRIKNQFVVNYPRLYYYSNTADCSQLYNAILFSKGIILNSNIEITKLISESKDSTIINKYHELRRDKAMLNKVCEDNKYATNSFLADSLEKVIDDKEEWLISSVKEYGDYTKKLNVKWNEIRDNLKPEDLAVEFLRIPIHNDSIIYVALIVRSDSKTPRMIKLFEEKQIETLPDTLSFCCKEMADLIWKPLEQELDGVKNIFFSPSGLLYNIGVEYLPGYESYNFYRLSSTRELLDHVKNELLGKTVLYGGLDYYASRASDKNGNSDLSDDIISEYKLDKIRGMGVRGGKERLPHTKNEVIAIGKELSKVGLLDHIFTDKEGTEESIKALSGRQTGCLHIATHGFYYSLEEAKEYDDLHFILLEGMGSNVYVEDKALTRSGLLMSGANNILEGNVIPSETEDGVLTAKEISNIDLKGLDLVVLSACQTGLGDISQGEGVFGLQRGFKKAGAKSILMSLWEVDDNATQLFMVQFYRNMLSGKTKRQSLTEAQNYLRKYENGKYDDPKYWAAFILLDGLD